MSNVGENEAGTQNRVADFFLKALGYSYLSCWKNSGGNSNIEEDLLSVRLKGWGHSDRIIARVLHEVGKAARAPGTSKTLYDANRYFQISKLRVRQRGYALKLEYFL